MRETLLEVDVIGFCLPADQRIGPGDPFIASELTELQRGKRTPGRGASRPRPTRSTGSGSPSTSSPSTSSATGPRSCPCSATRGDQVDELRDVLRRAPAALARPLYPDGVLTDEPEAVMIAELVREAALEGVRDELPHSLAVVVEEMVPARGPPRGQAAARRARQRLRRARLSQKAIVIGRGGSRLREVGTNARAGIEALLGQRVYLDLHVKVAKDWQRDPKQLQRLGF